jgi:hypothetical protein
MPDENMLTLQDIAPYRNWWFQDAGAHYRKLAQWLRERASMCCLPVPQREFLASLGDMSAAQSGWNGELGSPNDYVRLLCNSGSLSSPHLSRLTVPSRPIRLAWRSPSTVRPQRLGS